MILQVSQLSIIAFLTYIAATNWKWILYGEVYRLLYYWTLSWLLSAIFEFIATTITAYSSTAFKLLMVTYAFNLCFFVQLTSTLRWRMIYGYVVRLIFYVPAVLSILLCYASKTETGLTSVMGLTVSYVSPDMLMVILLILYGSLLAAGSVTLAYHLLTVHPVERKLFIFPAAGILVSALTDCLFWILPILEGYIILGFHVFIVTLAWGGMILTARMYSLAFIPIRGKHSELLKSRQGEVTIFFHEKPLHSRSIFENYMRNGFTGLYIYSPSGEAVLKANLTLRIDKSGLDGTVHPAHVNRLKQLIWDFCQRVENPVVLFEGLEEVMAQVGWEETLKLVDSLIDIAEVTGALIFIWVEPELFNRERFMLLSRHIKIV